MNKVRFSGKEVGYLELPGAVKDSDCSMVEVDGGVSSKRGCCNSFRWKPNPEYFRCGECKFLENGEQGEQEEGKRPITKREAASMTDEELIDSNRPVFGRTERE